MIALIDENTKSIDKIEKKRQWNRNGERKT